MKPMRKVVVKPKSSKAKNRLANIMENNPVCIVEQDSGGELFLAAENRKYFMWVSTRTGTNRFGDKADAHWEIVSEIKDVLGYHQCASRYIAVGMMIEEPDDYEEDLK